MDDRDQFTSASASDAQELLSLWFENSPLGMTMIQLHERTFRINRAFAEMLGYSVQELLGNADQSRFTHPDDLELDRRNVERLLAGEQVMARWDKRYIHADGHVVWARVTLFLLRGDDGAPRVLIAQIEDLTRQRELERKLALAERDTLTGLNNRDAFERAASEQLARCKRYGEHAALLMLDLDQLKQINDTHGHLVGDEALRTVGNAVSQRLRASDLACRFGGDEFVVLLPQTGIGDAQTVADQIELTIQQTPVTAPAGAVKLTASIGVAHMDADTPDAKAALSEADASMYAVKRRRLRPGH
jgi:diguanylate cyclase (GGDEF)-like protein/PAS domain S-box-containing protein